MSLVFEDTVPVKSTGTGRKAAPNPYTDIVKAIAGKTIGKNDKGIDPNTPVAKAFTQTLTGKDDEDKTTVNRIRRQLQDAGDVCDPKVTVHVRTADTDKKNVIKVTFWTVAKQKRPRKPKVATETASSPQTQVVTNAK